MLKIWAKTMLGDKITADMIFKRDENYNEDRLLDYLSDICHTFDIPTPVILKSHRANFEKFNIARFRVSDFIESIDFDTLIIENASE